MMGWNGIAVSLLAANNPIGIIFSALFISHISVGGTYLKTSYFPTEIASVISGIIIYLCAFSLLFQTGIKKFWRRRKQDSSNAATESGESPPDGAAGGKGGGAE